MAALLTGDSATFASGIADWNRTTGAANFTIAHSATDGGVLLATVTTGAAQLAVASHTVANTAKPAVTEDETITVGASCKQVNGTARNWRVEVNWYDSANAAAAGGGNFLVAAGTCIVGSFVTLSGPITVPAGAAKVRLRVRWDNAAAGEAFRLDNAFIEDGQGTSTTVGGTVSYGRTSTGWVALREDRIT